MYNKIEGISYFFPVCDIIKQSGEEWVRESFDSIKDQSDDIIVVDYSSNDDIKKLTEEYNFRFFRINKVKGIPYYDARLWNKAILEAKYDIFVMLTPDNIMDKNLTNIILKWYEEHDYKKYFLTVSMLTYQMIYGKVFSENGLVFVYYRPFLLKVRGLDERTYIGEGQDRGTHRYSIRIMFEIFNLKKSYILTDSIHKYHPPRKVKHPTRYHQYMPRIILGFYAPKILNIIKKIFNILRKYIPIFNKIRQLTHSKVMKTLGIDFSITKLIDEINENFNEGVKKVINSYW